MKRIARYLVIVIAAMVMLVPTVWAQSDSNANRNTNSQSQTDTNRNISSQSQSDVNNQSRDMGSSSASTDANVSAQNADRNVSTQSDTRNFQQDNRRDFQGSASDNRNVDRNVSQNNMDRQYNQTRDYNRTGADRYSNQGAANQDYSARADTGSRNTNQGRTDQGSQHFATVQSIDQPEGCLRLRKGPSSSTEQVGCAQKGERLQLTGQWSRDGRWLELADGGWVFAGQVQSDLKPPRTASSNQSRSRARVYYQDDDDDMMTFYDGGTNWGTDTGVVYGPGVGYGYGPGWGYGRGWGRHHGFIGGGWGGHRGGGGHWRGGCSPAQTRDARRPRRFR